MEYVLDTGPEYALHFLQEPPHGCVRCDTISNSNKKNGRAVSFLSVILRFAAFPAPSLCWQIQSLLSECKPHVSTFVSVFVSVLFLFLFSLLCSDSTPNTTLAAAGLLTGCSAGRSAPSRTCPSPTPSSRQWS
jgi:hypothetical protein